MREDMIDDLRDGNAVPSTLTVAQCRKLRNLKLPTELDLSVFAELDFDALAARRRRMGRKPLDRA